MYSFHSKKIATKPLHIITFAFVQLACCRSTDQREISATKHPFYEIVPTAISSAPASLVRGIYYRANRRSVWANGSLGLTIAILNSKFEIQVSAIQQFNMAKKSVRNITEN